MRHVKLILMVIVPLLIATFSQASEESCQARLYRLLKQTAQYIPNRSSFPEPRTLEYCDELCGAYRLIRQIEAERALQAEIEQTLRNCQPPNPQAEKDQ